MFPPVDAQPDLPAREAAIAERWRAEGTFARTLAARAEGPLFSFNEGPPTANGRPGVHHVEARVFKDIFPRYRTMKGYRVPRKAGWDCHGIPVELEVEKQLGFTHKQQIEDHGVEAFNQLCRESVERYVDEWVRLTERIGFWVDTDDAYWTMSTSYIESVWWSLKQLWDGGLLYEGHKVVPHCGRCGTSLSDHEVALGYAEAEDPSVVVRMPVLEGPLAEAGASLAIWTTTPWTLISNTFVAVGERIRYVLAQAPGDDHPVVVAADLVAAVLGEGAVIHRDVAVDELVGVHYRGPFEFVRPAEGDFRYVVTAGFVTTDDGTGLVHLAPAFGADDHAVGLAEGVEVLNPVDLEGRFTDAVPPFAGRFVKDADDDIIADLRDRGLLISAGTYRHTYPFCWRCGSPLLYYAKPSWYIATSRHKDRLLAVNADTDWHPAHIRDGRYGDWLEHNVDWALSRSRYWGTPLPLWRCSTAGAAPVDGDPRGHDVAVGSLAELGDLADRDLSALDPHRPFVDDITFACPRATCDGTMHRVPDVIDAWYDSGAMPFAQFGYPYAPGSEQTFAERFPADYICEAIDQTRGWFYSQMAEATLLFDAGAYRTVLCLGHIVDADGKKMSKSLGNILSPWEVIDRHGADPLRWLLLTDGSPWVNRRVGHEPVEDVVRRFFLTIWNTHVFFTTYARMEGWAPLGPRPPVAERPVMDRWVLSELAALVRTVDTALEGYDATTAGQALEAFVDGLSNWYIRRSRQRFWNVDDERAGDADAAFWTLHECLVTLAALLAPFTPFLAEALYDDLVRSVDDDAPDSVHLLDFPRPDPLAEDPDLRAAMAGARQVTTLGLRARNEAQIGVRQPLPRALVHLPDAAGWAAVAEVVAEELNVKSIELSEGGGTVTYRLKPDFRELGRAFGSRTPDVAAAIGDADPATAVPRLRGGEPLALALPDGSTVEVTGTMVQVVEESREGWQVATDAGVTVALDLTVDEALRREGLARELIRTVNDLRKRQGLELSDRIRVEVAADGRLKQAVADHRTAICREVLATGIADGPASGGAFVEVGGHAARVRLEVA
ncbi:isoleucine--tRNA ligase [Euzebya sp.]|uniref:isoleucine--tRNA ligase n=1 Tax=Euzebya sp. TaxID=1971409 RepID=UPI00351972D6